MKIRRTNWRALSVLLTIQLLAILDIFIVNVALPTIRNNIGASSGETQLIVAAYMIGFAALMITGGKLGDQLGRKKIFLTGIIVFMVASLGCAMSYTPMLLIACRFVQGLGAAFMVPQVLSYIKVLFVEGKERTKAIGWYGVVIGAGTLLGQLLGGFFASLHLRMMVQPWRLIFVVNIPICILSVIAGIVLLPESKHPEDKGNDYTGVVMLSIGLFFFIYALTEANDLHWSLLVWGMIILSVLLLFGFVRLQVHNTRMNKARLINMKLFGYPNFTFALLAVSFFMIMIDSYFFVLTIFLQMGMHLSPLSAGYAIIVQGAGFILASIVAPNLFSRYGARLLIVALSIIIISMLLQAVFDNPSTSAFVRYIFMIFHGAGVALVLPPLANIALSGLPDHLAGNASGVYATFQQIFGAIGIAVCGNIFFGQLSGHDDFGDYSNAFRYSILVNIISLCCVMLIMIIFIRNKIT